MNKENKDQILEKEGNLFMMGITSILLLIITAFLIGTTLEIQKKFSFKFAENTIFVESKGIEEYSIDKLKDKITFMLSASYKMELELFLEKIIDLKEIKKVKPKLIDFVMDEKLLNQNIKILNITKVYGKTKELKGNRKLLTETNAKYKVSLEVNKLTTTKDTKYITVDLIVNSLQQIVDFKYYINDNLKEFYEAIKISKVLNLKTLPNYISNKLKNKISVRNLFIKPSGTPYKLNKVEYTRNQIRILVNIDNKKYALIYSKGKIINVIKIREK